MLAIGDNTLYAIEFAPNSICDSGIHLQLNQRALPSGDLIGQSARLTCVPTNLTIPLVYYMEPSNAALTVKWAGPWANEWNIYIVIDMEKGIYDEFNRERALGCAEGFYPCDSYCEICTEGFYCDGRSEMACAPGTYSAAGAVSCTRCPAGSISGAMAAGCTRCVAGAYTDDGVVCRVCPAGHACPDGVLGALCGLGGHAAEGAGVCTSCGGDAVSQPERAACTPCETGVSSFHLFAEGDECVEAERAEVVDGELRQVAWLGCEALAMEPAL